MSKRFGRQQKRRLKAQVAYLEGELATVRTLGETNRQIVADVAQTLGQHFVCLPPSSMRVTANADVVYMHKQIRDLGEALTTPPFHAAFVPHALHVIKADVIDVDPIREAVHIRVDYPDGRAGYALSRMALEAIPKRVLFEHIAKNIAHQITQEYGR